MKVKPTPKPGHVTVDLDAGDDQILEKGVATAKGAVAPVLLHRILVPIDFSDCSTRALDYAVGLAEKFGASLILLHVVEPTVYPENYLLLPQAMEEIHQSLVQAARERLATLVKKRSSARPRVEFLVRLGHAHSEISDTAQAMGADLIVVGTHGRSGLKQALLGGTAERVVRQAPCPVLTVRHTGGSASENR
jgi:universal stress protein A